MTYSKVWYLNYFLEREFKQIHLIINMNMLLLPLLLKVLDRVIYDQTPANYRTENKIFCFFCPQVYLPGYLFIFQGFWYNQSWYSAIKTKSHRFF